MATTDELGAQSMATPAQNASSERYISKWIRRWVLQVNRRYDLDMIAHLEGTKNVNEYLKGLVRADMEANGVHATPEELGLTVPESTRRGFPERRNVPIGTGANEDASVKVVDTDEA